MSANIEVLRVEIAKLQLQPGDILVIKVAPEYVDQVDISGHYKWLPAGTTALLLPLESEIETIHGTRVDHDHTDQP